MIVGREGSVRAYPETASPTAITRSRITRATWRCSRRRQINDFARPSFRRVPPEDEEHAEGFNLLDQSLICCGSGLSDGNVHTHDQLPTLLAGRGGGFVSPGRHVIYQRETPVTNLFMTMLDRVGVTPDQVGDSTGRLTGLSLG